MYQEENSCPVLTVEVFHVIGLSHSNWFNMALHMSRGLNYHSTKVAFTMKQPFLCVALVGSIFVYL